MKKVFLIISILGIIGPSFGQYFTLSIPETIVQAPPLQNAVLAGSLINVSGDTLDVKMVRLQNNLPSASWMSFICLRFCLPPTIDSASTMDPGNYAIPPGDSALVEVLFLQTDSIPGTASAEVKFATMQDEQVEIVYFEASTLVSSISGQSKNISNNFVLFNNYPNPFNNQTVISAHINSPGKVDFYVFDLLGREVYRADNLSHGGGMFTLNWSGKNHEGIELSSGIYFYQLNFYENNRLSNTAIKKLTLIR